MKTLATKIFTGRWLCYPPQARPRWKLLLIASSAALLLATCRIATAATVHVGVESASGPGYFPPSVTIQVGDTVEWNWADEPHVSSSVTSGVNGVPNGIFDSGVHTAGYTFSYTFQKAGRFDYFSRINNGTMFGVVKVVDAAPAAHLLNISTRLRVQTGEKVMIGGFIITGSAAKKIIIRGLGPSLAQAGIADALPDPVVELRAGAGSLMQSNNNWKDTQASEIQASGVAPTDDLESAIVATVNPGSYTAVLSGNGSTSGVGLVEVYDLDQTADAKLANISTRGFVLTGTNVMIGGFILGNGSDSANVLIRGLGPSLTQAGVAGALADPTLELRDSNGGLVGSNDNWKDTQQAEIQATGVAPQNDQESAIVANLAPAAYTAIVAAKDGGTGVALVEAYRLQ